MRLTFSFAYASAGDREKSLETERGMLTTVSIHSDHPKGATLRRVRQSRPGQARPNKAKPGPIWSALSREHRGEVGQ